MGLGIHIGAEIKPKGLSKIPPRLLAAPMRSKGKSIALLTGIALLGILAASGYLYRAHLRFWWQLR